MILGWKQEEVPTDIHHIQSRGAHPEKTYDPDNVVGLSRAEHSILHANGLPVKKPGKLPIFG